MLVEAVAGDRGAIGLLRLLVLRREQEPAEALRIDNGDGASRRASETIQDGTYKPLSRPLFVYANEGVARPSVVRAFIRFMIVNQNVDRTAERASCR